MIRFTVSMRHRSDAEVLHYDSGALPSLAEVFHGLGEVEAALADHAAAISEGGAELVVWVAARSFTPHEGPAPRRQRRVPPPGEF